MRFAASLPWRGDFAVDDHGHLIMVEGDIAYQERIIRRLLTTPRLFDRYTGVPIAVPDYIFNPPFGAGLRRLVNRVISIDELTRLITGQILEDAETKKSVKPKVEVEMFDDGTLVTDIVAVREPNSSMAFGINITA